MAATALVGVPAGRRDARAHRRAPRHVGAGARCRRGESSARSTTRVSLHSRGRSWQNDTSYEVRAAALTALIQRDSTNRHALIVQGLATPSYRDVIQNAALVGVARSNDTALVDDVQRIVGDQELPARVLGALGGRGNQHALDVLVSDLNDSRAWVRQWALAGFSSIPPAQRLTALRGAEPSLKYPETRAAVQRAIDALNARR